MKKFLPIIRNSQLFAGIAEEDITEILACLDAKTTDYQKDCYILRIGDTIEALGLMLSGKAFIIQEDFWGNRNVMSFIGQGQSFAETFASMPGAPLNVSVVSESPCTVMFLNIKRILTVCPAGCGHHSRMIRNLLSDLAN